MPDRPAQVRRRLTGVLFSGVGFTSTGFIAAITVAGLAAEDLTGSSSFAGIPAAASTIGTALGSAILASATVRLGRRPILIGAYVIAGTAAAVAALAVGSASFALLIFAMFSLGFGNSASHLTRYAAADLHQPSRRTAAIGWIVWASTIGSVAGPNLLRWSADLAEDSGLAPFAGPYLVAAIAFLAAALFYQTFRGVEGMGGGDIKMAAMLGAWLGWQGLLMTLLLASFVGTLIGVGLILTRRADARTALPFGAFLAPAAAIVLLAGRPVWHWYLSLAF